MTCEAGADVTIVDSLIDEGGIYSLNRRFVPLDRIADWVLKGIFLKLATTSKSSVGTIDRLYQATMLLKAELDRRGLPDPRNKHVLIRDEGGTCFCGKRAMYVVGSRGYCRAHQTNARLARTHASIEHDKSDMCPGDDTCSICRWLMWRWGKLFNG
jgi:hypothetical protein